MSVCRTRLHAADDFGRRHFSMHFFVAVEVIVPFSTSGNQWDLLIVYASTEDFVHTYRTATTPTPGDADEGTSQALGMKPNYKRSVGGWGDGCFGRHIIACTCMCIFL